ncbi:MAG: sigma-70 family RNA polymerase sigma factor [Actinomycetota bacterium]|nr:sigma-70 family RNA polymerase sigma factor [Actinomycetota bacterium]
MRDPGGRRRRAATGTGAASARFEQLFTDYQLPIARYAQRRVAEHAVPDVVAEVFTVAWRRLSDIATPELPWLYQVAHHVIANSNRHHRREAELVRLQGSALAGMSDDDPAMAATSRLAAATAFGQLGDRDREILGLVAWEGLDLGDLAKTLGVSRGTATVRVHRARNRLVVALRHCSDPQPMSLEAAHD